MCPRKSLLYINTYWVYIITSGDQVVDMSGTYTVSIEGKFVSQSY